MDINNATLSYQQQLSSEGRLWLNNRGITDGSIERFRLGEVLQPTPVHKRFRGSISIPYLNPDGSVRSLRFRYLHGSIQKYDSVAGFKSHLFNVAATAGHSEVFICEGEFDSIILSQLGKYSTGVSGANVFKQEWKYLYTNCERVSIIFDGDEAGKAGASRIASILGNVVEDLRVIHLPPGTDVTDVYLSSPEALKDLL